TSPDTVYVATKGNGLYKTTNGAESWVRVAAKSPSEEEACTYVNVISIDPANTNIIYIAGANISNTYGIFKSEDGGKNFVKLFQPAVGITSLQISPADSKVIYAASYGAGVYKSVDGGITWQSYNKGMVDQYLRTIAIDPSSPETIYAGSNQSGIYKSVDGGQTWVTINNGFRGVSGVFGASVQTILIDSQAKVIYVGASGNGIFKSIDGGNSWYDINKDLIVNNSYPYINCFMLDPTKKILYAGTDDYGVISYE
ncbi:MAG: hypothetical protein JNN15_20465, partial [Blastocatellia bacterium]|nr:hypothetical protein [Blastocatellia bacterium]